MIITDGPAQMIIAAPDTGHGWYPAWVIHNDSETVPVYFGVNQNIMPVPGSSSFILEPGMTISLTAQQTYWARTPAGTVADLHLVPSATYGAPTGAAAPTAFSAGGQ